MTDIDKTISNLIATVDPGMRSVCVARPVKIFLLWLLITFMASGALLFFSTLRPDLIEQLSSPLFVGEVLSLFFLILSSAFTAVWLCYPDLRQKPWVLLAPIPFLVAFIVLSVYRALHPEMTVVLEEDTHTGMACVGCITMYALIPGFWMFRTLRQYATTRPRLAGALSLLTAASIGLLVLKFVEGNDSVAHLLLIHTIPVIVFGVLGVFLGQKFLRW